MSEQDDSNQTEQSAAADALKFDADRAAAELKLGEQDKVFALALLNGANQTQAARMAGFPQEGIALRKKASTLANTNKVQRFLERARAAGAGLAPEEVVDRETRRLLLSRDATGHDRQVAMRAIEQLNKMDADETAEEAERTKQDLSPTDVLDMLAEVSPLYAAKLAKENNLPPPLLSIDAIKKMMPGVRGKDRSRAGTDCFAGNARRQSSRNGCHHRPPGFGDNSWLIQQTLEKREGPMAILPDGPGIKRGEYPALPATVADNLLLPASGGGGLFSAQTVSSKVTRILIAAGVTGVSSDAGIEKNAEAYVAYIDAIYDAAGAAAVTTWLNDH